MAATAERKAGWILAAIALIEGSYVTLNFVLNGRRFVRYLGFASGRAGSWPAWLIAAVVTVIFVAASARFPSVRANLFRPSWLKLLGVAVAISAGILEELVFRKLVMDAVAHRGGNALLQIAISAILFGVGHGVWGLMGKSMRVALGATLATAALGAALGVIYVIGGRSLAPCVMAHLAINLFIEPGLALAATSGEMGRPH